MTSIPVMLPPYSVRQRDHGGQQSGSHLKIETYELPRLEPQGGKSSSSRRSKNSIANQCDTQNHGRPSFSFQKLRFRRSSKKKVSSTYVERSEKGSTERIKKLKEICEDLSGSSRSERNCFNSASTACSSQAESRDDCEMSSFGNYEKEQRIGGRDQTEILKTVSSTTELLSKLYPDLSKESSFQQDTRDPAPDIPTTVSGCEESIADVEEPEQLVDTNEKEKLNKHFYCGFIDCKIFDAIENLMGCLAPQESKSVVPSHNLFCGVSQLWDLRDDEKESLAESKSITHDLQSVELGASVVRTESSTNPTENPSIIQEDATENPTNSPADEDRITLQKEDDAATRLYCGVFDCMPASSNKRRKVDAAEIPVENSIEKTLQYSQSTHSVVSSEQVRNNELEAESQNVAKTETDDQQLVVTLEDIMNEDDDEVNDLSIPSVSTMDFIPRFEVVGFKGAGTPVRRSAPTKKVVEKTRPKHADDHQQLVTVSTMDFIPRLEVVGYKSGPSVDPENDERPTNETTERRNTSSRKSGNGEDRTAAQEKRSRSKRRAPGDSGDSSSKSSKSQNPQKISQRAHRKKVAKKRRQQRRQRQLARQKNRSTMCALGTIEEAPAHMEQPSMSQPSMSQPSMTQPSMDQSSHISSNFEKNDDPVHLETPETPEDNALGELSMNAFAPDLAEAPRYNSPELDLLSEEGSAVPLGKARSAPMLIKESQSHSTMSRLYSSGWHQPSVEEKNEYFDTVTSSLSTWTANKSAIKRASSKAKKTLGSDKENSQKKKPWFFQSAPKEIQQEPDFGEIVENLSPVLSIPMLNTFETEYERERNEDNEYVEQYYDFGEDDIDAGTAAEEYAADSGEFDRYDTYDGYDGYDEEEQDDECYVFHTY